jgi:hypothetical protein
LHGGGVPVLQTAADMLSMCSCSISLIILSLLLPVVVGSSPVVDTASLLHPAKHLQGEFTIILVVCPGACWNRTFNLLNIGSVPLLASFRF